MKAVIVEDEIRIREGICKLLGKLFPEITVAAVAENGLEGLAFMEYHKPDLVITDIRMPGLDGLEMLMKAQALGLTPKVIILTAYSEFAYAQQAVRLGVQDYLVKPISVPEFTQTIRRVQSLWEQEQQRTPETMGNLENILSGLLHGTSGLKADAAAYLEKKYGLCEDTPLLLLPVYLGGNFLSRQSWVRQELERLLLERMDIRWCVTDIVYDQTILAVVYQYSAREDFERWYANRIPRLAEEGICGIAEISGLRELRKGYRMLLSHLDWAIPMGKKILISHPGITLMRTDVCVYPIELENQIKAAVCTGESSRARKIGDQFQKYFQGGLYAPGEIKNSCVRFLWAFLNVAKEVGCLDGSELDQRELLAQIAEAKTAGELYRPFEVLFSRMRIASGDSEGASLAVRRAQSMIREFYADGITLGEIAARLSMSQEYLGTQFHKEVGEPFSVYIRNVRMAKAKELLIGTQLKQYEIAQRVGYADPKYFARVFRECEGMGPAEYRKSFR